MKKREPSYTVCGNVNGAATIENNGSSSKKSEIELPYNPANLLLDIFLKKSKTLIQKDIALHAHCSIIYSNQDMEAPQWASVAVVYSYYNSFLIRFKIWLGKYGLTNSCF